MDLNQAIEIVSQHKEDCDKIEAGSPCNPLPRHSQTVDLFLAIRTLAFKYVDDVNRETDEQAEYRARRDSDDSGDFH